MHRMHRPRPPRAQKQRKGTPAYTLYVNRRLGAVVAQLADRLGLAPNQVTVASALISAGGIAVLATCAPTRISSAAAAVLLLVGYAFDSADGQLARLSGRSSLVGEWLDHVFDAAKHVALPAAILVGALRFLDVPSPLLALPLAAQLVAVVTFSSMLLLEVLRRASPIPPARVWDTSSVLRVALLKLPVDFGVTCLVVATFGTSLFWWLYGLQLCAATGYLAVHAREAIRRLNTARPAVVPAVVPTVVSAVVPDAAAAGVTQPQDRSIALVRADPGVRA